MKTRSYLSPPQLAEKLGVCRQTINRWISQGIIRASQNPGPRGRWRITYTEYLRVLRMWKDIADNPDRENGQFDPRQVTMEDFI